MTAEDIHDPFTTAQEMVELLQQELIAANNEFIALTLELEDRVDQLRLTNQRLAQEIIERRHIEAALQVSELRFRALVEKSADGILLLDHQTVCTYVSPSVQRILGYSPRVLEGKTLFNWIHPKDLETIQQALLQCLSNPGTDISLAFRFRDSHRRWRYLEGVCCNRLHEFAVQAIVLNYRDVTERHRAEQQIRKLNRTLEQQVKLRTSQLELAFEFEASLKRVTDKVRDSLDESQIMQTVVQELAQAIPGCSCNASLYNLEHETARICYESTRFSCSYQGRELQMNAYSEIYSQILHGKTFQFCSLTPNPERGAVSTLVQPIADDQGVLGDLWLVNQKHYQFGEQDIRLVQLVANQCAIALRQSRLYQQAQFQIQELESLNLLKDDFLSTVSHELRSPMANIKMSTQLLALRLHSGSSHLDNLTQRYIQILQDECNREINLINDLLDLARLDTREETLEFVPINLHQHLSTLIEPFFERTHTQHQQLRTEIPDELPIFSSHLDYFDRILIELLHNACKYTPPNERIILSASSLLERDWAESWVKRLKVSPCSSLLIQLTNTGVEISSEEQNRIFDKFYRIPQNDPWRHGGTGLGLALVKKLMEGLKGWILVESGNNQTSFLLLFPLNSGNAEA